MEPNYGVRKRHEAVQDYTKISKRTDCDYTDVIISDFDEHSATEVCQSATSSGPDFVSLKEKLLCDMCTHELRPLCSGEIVSDCFDLENLELRSGNFLIARDGGNATVQAGKQYLNGINWRRSECTIPQEHFLIPW